MQTFSACNMKLWCNWSGSFPPCYTLDSLLWHIRQALYQIKLAHPIIIWRWIIFFTGSVVAPENNDGCYSDGDWFLHKQTLTGPLTILGLFWYHLYFVNWNLMRESMFSARFSQHYVIGRVINQSCRLAIQLHTKGPKSPLAKTICLNFFYWVPLPFQKQFRKWDRKRKGNWKGPQIEPELILCYGIGPRARPAPEYPHAIIYRKIE